VRGSIERRRSRDGKRVAYRVRWETRGPGGERRQHSETAPTKDEAESLLAQKVAGRAPSAGRMTVGQWMDRWLEAAAAGVEPSTAAGYRVALARLRPRLGAVRLGRLGEDDVAAAAAALLATGYKPGTVRRSHAVLSQCLGAAVKRRLVARNAAADAGPPKAERGAVAHWDGATAARFLRHRETAADPLAPLWRFALDSGCRVSECIALRWADLDLAGGRAAVRRTMTDGAAGPVAADRTKRGRGRSIDLSPATVAALKAHRRDQTARRLASPVAWEGDLVFDRGDGGLLSRQLVARRLAAAARAAGAPPLSPHGLRHTCATLLLAAGVHPKVVQERLGHASVAVTLDVYSHAAPGMQAAAAAELGRLLG